MNVPDAYFTQIQKKPRKKGRIFLILLIIICLLAAAAYGGYRYYLYYIEKRCKDTTVQIMTCVHDMDFSSLNQEYLPASLKENGDLKQLISTNINNEIEEAGVSDLLNDFNVTIDYDAICEQLMANADYKISNVSATYNKCTVEMTTTNVNYSGIIADFKSEYSDVLKQSSSYSGLWGTISEWVGGIVSDITSDISLPSELSDYMASWCDSQEKNTVSGKITYGIKDGHWTLLSFDENLINNYYGFPEEQ